jgi:hypothetical protein
MKLDKFKVDWAAVEADGIQPSKAALFDAAVDAKRREMLENLTGAMSRELESRMLSGSTTAADVAPDPGPMTLEKLQAATAELAPLPPDPLNGAVALYYADGMEAGAKLLAAEYDKGPFPRGLSISPRWWLPAGTIWGMKPADGFGVEICVVIGPKPDKPA